MREHTRKLFRLFDTIGSFLGLFGLIIGLCSVFVDQYDLDFEPQGQLKMMSEAFKDFQSGIRLVAEEVKNIYKVFDINVTCEAIYNTIATGSVAAIFLSLVPGKN